jgi:energy-coupling factor transporter ATP-binding protein EcfA2
MTEIQSDLSLQPLNLPIRFESLEREIDELGINITSIIEKVENATVEIESLLRQINHGNIGKFKLFYGESGKGKTTFLRTLENFFEKIEVITINRKIPLGEIPNYILKEKPEDIQAIFIIEDRDNPSESHEELRAFFEELRFLFRKELFDVLIIWPITDKISAEDIDEIAWTVGRDSVTSSNGCIFKFEGLCKDRYYDIADTTSININQGRNLESYGITKKSVTSIIKNSDTLGQFYSSLTNLSLEKIENTETFLKNKIVPKIWVLLPGDEATEIDRTVSSLTRGIKYKLDIERILSELDNPNNVNSYLNDWRTRRESAAYLMQLVDIRLFPVSPTLSVSAIRAFGDENIKSKLKKKKETKANAIAEVKKTAFYKLLIDDYLTSDSSPKKTTITTSNEYIRIQKEASKNDKVLNKALGECIQEALKSDGINFEIFIEKQNIEGSNMQPDIQIKIDEKTSICLEPTWRTTGRGILDEKIIDSQNSLTKGTIQQYVLNKAMDYLKSLGK